MVKKAINIRTILIYVLFAISIYIIIPITINYILQNEKLNVMVMNTFDPLNFVEYSEFIKEYPITKKNTPLYIFYHICTTNMKIVEEQVGEIVNSGLYGVAEKIFYGCNCSNCDAILEKYMVNYHKFTPMPEAILPNDKTYENGTVNSMIEYARGSKETFYALYIHTKGTSNLSKAQQDWRRFMMYWLVTQYSLCIDILSRGFYTVGLSYTNSLGANPKHYSGNFFWADSEYLKTLNTITDMSNRYLAEHAILSKYTRNKHITLLKERYLALDTSQGMYSFSPRINPTSNPYLAII